MNAKSVAALDAGTVPDIAYSDTYDVQTAGKWAFDGKLEDLSDVLGADEGPLRGGRALDRQPLQRQGQEEGLLRLPDQAADAAHPVLEGHAGARPASRRTTFPAPGRNTGRSGATRCSPASARRPASACTAPASRWAWSSTDSFQSFLSWVDAYNVKLVDDNGKLLVDDPKVKAGLVAALTDYTQPYIKGCTPPSSTTWKDPDNNVAFHNKTT